VFAGSALAREQTIACNQDYGALLNIRNNKQCAPSPQPQKLGRRAKMMTAVGCTGACGMSEVMC